MKNVLNILYKKCQEIDTAKTAVLILLEIFVKEGLFGANEVTNFIENQFSSFSEERFFKIRRPFLKCLVTVSRHLSQD